MSNKLICRICLKIVEGDTYKYLNAGNMNEIDKCRSLGELLEECVSEVNLQLTESPLICDACLVLLQISIHFKEVCSRTEEQVYNYMKFNDCLEKCSNIDLKEVIKLKDKCQGSENTSLCDETFESKPNLTEKALNPIENVNQICRTCLKVAKESELFSGDVMIDVNKNQIVVKKLEECVSLICLQSTNSLFICSECNEMLKSTYTFKQTCCETEEELYSYMKFHDLHLDKSSNIHLIDVLNLKNKSQIFEENSSGNINQDSQFSCVVSCSTVESSISDEEIINLPRTRREASKIANARILSLTKQDLETDFQEFDEESSETNLRETETQCLKPNQKGSKSHRLMKTPKESKSHSRKQNPKELKPHLRKSVLTKSKAHTSRSNFKKLKSQLPKSNSNETLSRHFKCKKCHYKAYRMDLLIRHKLKCKNKHKSREEIKNKKCKHCSKKFSRNSHLMRHQFTHTLISNFVCDKCGQVFAEKYQLKVHEAKHTQAEGSYKCHHCDKKFFRNCDLLAHVRRTVSKKKGFICKYCNKEFGDKRDRLSHISKYHTGEDLPFKCNNCSFKTVYSKRFHSHKKKCH